MSYAPWHAICMQKLWDVNNRHSNIQIQMQNNLLCSPAVIIGRHLNPSDLCVEIYSRSFVHSEIIIIQTIMRRWYHYMLCSCEVHNLQLTAVVFYVILLSAAQCCYFSRSRLWKRLEGLFVASHIKDFSISDSFLMRHSVKISHHIFSLYISDSASTEGMLVLP